MDGGPPVRGALLEPVIGLDPSPVVAARTIADLTSAVCGVDAVVETMGGRTLVVFPVRKGWDVAEVAAAITLERVTPALSVPGGRIAVAVGWGYGPYEQQQIVKAIAKVLHGMCEIHTEAISAIEAGSCPLSPRVAAWPWELAEPMLAWLAAAGSWMENSKQIDPELHLALIELDEALREMGG